MDTGRITQRIQICGSDSNKPNFHIEYMSRRGVGRALFPWVIGAAWHGDGAGHHGVEQSLKPAHLWCLEQWPRRRTLHLLPKKRAYPLLLFIWKTFSSEKLPCTPWAAPALRCSSLGGSRQRRENCAQEHLSFSPNRTVTAPVPGNLSRELLWLGERQGKCCKGLDARPFCF